jgi:hypothetical protein
MTNEKLPKEILQCKPKGSRNKGRPWKNTVKMWSQKRFQCCTMNENKKDDVTEGWRRIS